MRVIWHTEAEEGRDEVAGYIRNRFGNKHKDRFMQEVRQATRMLGSHPNIGPIDPLFAEFQHTYRSIVIGGLSKMVYRIQEDAIHIVAFWDCRQEPESQATKVKD